MPLVDELKKIAQKYESSKDKLQTEEASKNALILPFIRALGYDPFDPDEVVPEFTADIANRKGEKIDYAITSDGEPIMLIECKWCGTPLTADNLDQLARYFMVVPTRIAILTNGYEYEFYSDIDEAKTLDKKPFFKFTIDKIDENTLRELSKYCKENFKLDDILDSASELKYTNAIKKYFLEMLNEPDEEFVKFLVRKVYDGRLNASAIERFKGIAQKALTLTISERVSDRLASALKREKDSLPKPEAPQDKADEADISGIVTMPEEMDAFNILRAILCKVVSPDRIAMRDTKSYCGILFDDNNRMPIARLYIGKTSKYISTFEADKTETKLSIESLADIYKYADKFIATVNNYINSQASEHKE